MISYYLVVIQHVGGTSLASMCGNIFAYWFPVIAHKALNARLRKSLSNPCIFLQMCCDRLCSLIDQVVYTAVGLQTLQMT